MTVRDRVYSVIGSAIDLDEGGKASVEKMIFLAYFMGREDATVEVSYKYAAHIKEQRKRANACRYSKMANAVVGTEDYLYCSDYRQDMTALFGGDEADI